MSRAAVNSGVTGNFVAQAVSSLSNVVVTVLVARQVTAQSFGSFSVLVSTFVLTCGLGRAFIGEPLLALHASMNRVRSRGVIGAALTLGSLLGAAVAAIAVAMTSGDVRVMLCLLAIALPLLVVEDVARYMFFAAGKPLTACALDLVWLALATVGVIAIGHGGGVVSFAEVWLVSGCLAGVLGWLAASPQLPRDTVEAVRWLLPLGGRYGVEFLTSGALVALPVFVLALWASPADAGGFRAAQTLLGPANVAYAAMATYFVPLANRGGLATSKIVDGSRRIAMFVSGAVLGRAMLLVLLPVQWLAILVGDSAPAAHRCLPTLGLASVLLAVGGGAVVGHRALKAAGASLRVRLLLVPVGVALPIAGVFVAGLVGVLVGVVAFAALSAVAWWGSLLRLGQTMLAVPLGAS